MRFSPRVILIFVLLLIAVGSGAYLFFSKKSSVPVETPTSPTEKVIHENLENAAVNDVVEFEGTLTGFNDGCTVDASCVAVVDGYQVVTAVGLIAEPPEVGTSDVWREDIGKKVKVKAKKVQADLYAIIGAKDLYVLKIK